MIATADKADRTLMVGQVRRFDPSRVFIKNLYQSRELGECVFYLFQSVSGHREPSTPWRTSARKCGGWFLNLLGSHSLDLIFWTLAAKPKAVNARLASNSPIYEGETDGLLQITLDNGAQVSYVFSRSAKVGKEGSSSEILIGSKQLLDVQHLLLDGEPLDFHPPEKWDMFAAQLREFVSAIREAREPEASGRQIRPTVALIEAAFESNRRQEIVRVE